MKIVLIGAVIFTRRCLDSLLAAGGNVVGVAGPRPGAATINSDFIDMSAEAQKRGLPGLAFDDIRNPETIAAIAAMEPDVIFVCGLSQLLPPALFALPPLGVIGTHPSLLPHGRGRHPLIWTLVEGLTTGGLTFFRIDQGVDSGDIVWQRAFPIDDDDDATTLYARIEALADDAFTELIPALASRAARFQPQDHTKATVWRRRTQADGEVDWSASSQTIRNLIRALTRPYPGAHTWLNGHRLRLWKAVPYFGSPPENAMPGALLPAPQGCLRVRTGDGVLEITDWDATNYPVADLLVLPLDQCLGRQNP